MIQKKIRHSLVEKYIPSPTIDEDKLLLLYAIFDEIDLSNSKKESYIMTVMLVQIALDTHDKVTNHRDAETTEFIQRQITALAGDYYSGLYYLLLSELKDIKMIRTLAEAIKEINEHKIRLYHDKVLTQQAKMESELIVETTLFQKVTEHYNLDFWSLFSKKFLTYKKLSHEKFHNEDGQNNLSMFINKEPFPISSFKKAYESFYEETASLLDVCLFKTPSIKDILFKRLQNIRFDGTLHYNKTVEEGLS